MEISHNFTLPTPTLRHVSPSDWLKVYEPAEDSFLLLDALEMDMTFIGRKAPSLVLEVGSGSGMIISALGSMMGSYTHCLAVDINRQACEMTQRTFQAHNKSRVDVVNADLTRVLKPKSIDMIVFNPPYVVTSDTEITYSDDITKSWAGGLNGRAIIDKFITGLEVCMSESGFGYLLLLEENRPMIVIEMLKHKGFECVVIISRKIPGENLCVVRFFRSN